MDVVVWLRSLGLGKYEAVFRENDIDETVLPNLTAEDLKELGVASLGHRRKLLDAIAALRADTGVKVESPPAAPEVSPAATPAIAEVCELHTAACSRMKVSRRPRVCFAFSAISCSNVGIVPAAASAITPQGDVVGSHARLFDVIVLGRPGQHSERLADEHA